MAFSRLPYANRDLGVGIRVTRFVALAPIAGEEIFWIFLLTQKISKLLITYQS